MPNIGVLFSVLITEFNSFLFKKEPYPELYSEPSQISKMERFAEIVNSCYMFSKVMNTPLTFYLFNLYFTSKY